MSIKKIYRIKNAFEMPLIKIFIQNLSPDIYIKSGIF